MSVPYDARQFLKTAANSLDETTQNYIISEDIFTALEMSEVRASHVLHYLSDAGYINDLIRAADFDYPIMFKISAKGYDWLEYNCPISR